MGAPPPGAGLGQPEHLVLLQHRFVREQDVKREAARTGRRNQFSNIRSSLSASLRVTLLISFPSASPWKSRVMTPRVNHQKARFILVLSRRGKDCAGSRMYLPWDARRLYPAHRRAALGLPHGSIPKPLALPVTSPFPLERRHFSSDGAPTPFPVRSTPHSLRFPLGATCQTPVAWPAGGNVQCFMQRDTDTTQYHTSSLRVATQAGTAGAQLAVVSPRPVFLLILQPWLNSAKQTSCVLRVCMF